jgi:hypothetical protein
MILALKNYLFIIFCDISLSRWGLGCIKLFIIILVSCLINPDVSFTMDGSSGGGQAPEKLFAAKVAVNNSVTHVPPCEHIGGTVVTSQDGHKTSVDRHTGEVTTTTHNATAIKKAIGGTVSDSVGKDTWKGAAAERSTDAVLPHVPTGGCTQYKSNIAEIMVVKKGKE